MNYEEFIQSENLDTCFPKNKEKWVREFQQIISKKELNSTDINDKFGLARLHQVTSWSWMGFFFNVYWGAFYNSQQWLLISVLYSLGNLVELYFEIQVPFTAIVMSFIFAWYGKAWILASKINEINMKNELSEPSWKRVIVSLVIIFSPIILFGTFQ